MNSNELKQFDQTEHLIHGKHFKRHINGVNKILIRGKIRSELSVPLI